MTTLRTKIEEAAFWDGMVCLACGEVFPEEVPDIHEEPCPECGRLGLFGAKRTLTFLERVEAEDDGAD